MGYPSNVLAADEQVVLHRHPHWKRLIFPVLILLVVTAVAAFGAGFVNQTDWQSTAKNVVLLVILAVWLVIVGWLTVWPFLNWWTTHFVITDRRVMFRHGLLTRSGIDIPLARINSVEFRHGLLDRVLRTGTLIIESASQDPLEFHDIPRVERVHSLGRRSGVTVPFSCPRSYSSSKASAMPPAVSVDSIDFSGLRPKSSGKTQRRNAQNRKPICSRLPMMYAETKSAIFSTVSDTSGTRNSST